MVDMELFVQIIHLFLEITSDLFESGRYFFSHVHIREFCLESIENHREVFLDEIRTDYEAIFASEVLG